MENGQRCNPSTFTVFNNASYHLINQNTGSAKYDNSEAYEQIFPG
jgi:hypothetical protein